MPKSKKIRPSSTAGIKKGKNCQRSELKNLYSKDTRLHKTNPKLWLACVKEVQKVQNMKGNMNQMMEIVREREENKL